jgi:hypothetical protein
MPVIPARIAGIQKPWMAEFHIHVFWMPPLVRARQRIHGGMTVIIYFAGF